MSTRLNSRQSSVTHETNEVFLIEVVKKQIHQVEFKIAYILTPLLNPTYHLGILELPILISHSFIPEF